MSCSEEVGISIYIAGERCRAESREKKSTLPFNLSPKVSQSTRCTRKINLYIAYQSKMQLSIPSLLTLLTALTSVQHSCVQGEGLFNVPSRGKVVIKDSWIRSPKQLPRHQITKSSAKEGGRVTEEMSSSAQTVIYF